MIMENTLGLLTGSVLDLFYRKQVIGEMLLMKNFKRFYIKKKFQVPMVLIFACMQTMLFAQHRGDDLSFQGVNDLLSTNSGITHTNVFNASSKEIKSILLNPAGLGTLERIHVSFSGSSSERSWREAQYYRPNRLFVTFPFYLEGYYIPDPANNGILDLDLALEDSNYVVSEPPMGLDRFGEEAADWKKNINSSDFKSINFAIPLNLKNKRVVFAASYTSAPIYNYDRNITYLDPHLGFTDYNMAAKVDQNKPPIRVNWSDFQRERVGISDNIIAAFSYQHNDALGFGVSYNMVSLETEDSQSLNRIGYFDLIKDNRFSFSYDTLNVQIEGTSKFNVNLIKIGGLIQKNVLNFGVYVTLPATVNKESSYSFSATGQDSGKAFQFETDASTYSLDNELSLPATLNAGISVKPNDKFEFFLDIGQLTLGNNESSFKNLDTIPDTLYNDSDNGKNMIWSSNAQRKYLNNVKIQTGVKFNPFKLVSLFAGYQYLPQSFSPDGAAFGKTGPPEIGITFGIDFNLNKFGKVEAFWTKRELKYYDSYFSNTNYAFQSIENLTFSYSYKF